MLTRLYYRILDLFKHTGADWDKLAPTEENAIEFAHKFINEDPERMESLHVYSLEYCLAHSGEIINERYRSGHYLDDVDRRIPSMLEKYTTSTPLVVYRGVCDHVYEQMINNAKDIKGVDLVEKGFLATSIVKGREIQYDTKLRIYIPAGTHAVYQGNVNYEQGYYEVDVQHDAHLKIISIDKEYINCLLLKTA